jgi:hypothetical protein
MMGQILRIIMIQRLRQGLFLGRDRFIGLFLEEWSSRLAIMLIDFKQKFIIF